MNPQVTAALISAGVALTVAVLGIAGAIVAQTYATRRAFQGSLALFERQRAADEHRQHEQAQREDAFRFAEQRRSTYGRFASLARDLADANDAERTATKNSERIGRQLDRVRPGSASDLEESAEAAQQVAAAARTRREQLDVDYGAAREEIHLLGTPDVRAAADELWSAARQATHSAGADYQAARAAFLKTVRQELGIAPP